MFATIRALYVEETVAYAPIFFQKNLISAIFLIYIQFHSIKDIFIIKMFKIFQLIYMFLRISHLGMLKKRKSIFSNMNYLK